MPNIMSLGVSFKKLQLVKVVAFRLIQRQNSRYFRCPVWKTKSWQKSKPIRKLKHANVVLEYF